MRRMSALYPSYKQAMLEGTVSLLNDPIRLQLLAQGFDYDPAHKFLADVPDNAKRGAPAVVAGKTTNVPEQGVFDALDTSVASVPAGGAITAYVLYRDTGNPATSPLVAYIDGFYLEPQGGPVLMQHDPGPERIFALTVV
jgi:hypothetical protein